jgi:hypothetical protein
MHACLQYNTWRVKTFPGLYAESLETASFGEVSLPLAKKRFVWSSFCESCFRNYEYKKIPFQFAKRDLEENINNSCRF